MAVILLLFVCAWALFRALTKRAPLPELALHLIVICLSVFFLRYDHLWVPLGLAALITAMLLAALIIMALRKPGKGKPFGYAALFGMGLIIYFGIVSNYVMGWRTAVPNIATPLFDGLFYVVQGGNNLLVNGHRISSRATAQRYALDIVKLWPEGRSIAGLFPGDDLSQYAIYNESVYAPCSGTVLLRTNSFGDLPAGVSDPENPAGNYVAIGCDSGFTIVLAHLQPAIFPELGDRVESGHYIGKVGNTGNTTEPHLHIHAVAGLVKDERQALFTGDGIPFTVNRQVPFKNMSMYIDECPPVPGIEI